MTLEEIVNSLKSAGQDYGQLFNNNPKYTAVASNVTKGLENLVPPQFTNTQDAKSQEYSKKLAEWALGNGMGMSGMALGTKIPNPIKDNLNAKLVQKYLSTGKLSPDEMTQYEANGLAMETPQLQRYNLANAKSQIPNDVERMSSIGFNTPSYHSSRNREDIPKFRNRIAETSLFNGLGVHSGTKESAIQRASDTAGYNRETGKRNPDMAVYYPLQLRANKSFELNGKPVDEYGAELYLDSLGKPLRMGRESDVGREAIQDAYFKNNDVLKYINDVEDKGSISYISPAENVRSRFAAFDPLRKNSSSLLASGLLGALLFNNENKTSENK